MRREFLIEKEVLNVLRDAFLRRVMVILLQEKNVGPNVKYYVFVTPVKL